MGIVNDAPERGREFAYRTVWKMYRGKLIRGKEEAPEKKRKAIFGFPRTHPSGVLC